MVSNPRNGSRHQDAYGFEPLPSYIELAMATAAAAAHDGPQQREKGFLFSRFSTVERMIVLAIAGLALYGVALLSDGFYIKGKAAIAQVLVQRALAGSALVETTPTISIQPQNTKPLSATQ
ncbi:sortase A [Rhizobium azibense]|uniref:Sortase A n=2 Tax=Rhizobium azibense TaxID=1136135 RepID=A0A4R3RX92_9HYPH|nr:sortase A [Rhizobium azibense]